MRHFLVHPVLKAKKSFATRSQLFFIELSMFGKCTYLLGCIEVCQEREILMFFHSVPGLRKLINCGFWSKIWKMWFWKILRYLIFSIKVHTKYKVQVQTYCEMISFFCMILGLMSSVTGQQTFCTTNFLFLNFRACLRIWIYAIW